jgi:protein-S-isoprenylcysteine O-methyltransferase Ste14
MTDSLSMRREPTAEVKRGVARWLVRETFGVVFVAVLLFGVSGHWDWVMGWALVGVYAVWVGALAVVLIPRSPELLAERVSRSRKGVKQWDTILLSIVGLVELVKYVVAALDMRHGWSPPFPPALQLVGLAVAGVGYVVLGVWSMAANAYFSMVVRIQEDRGHAVVTDGPYRFVRHPGYLGSILFALATPLVLGSLWAFVPCGLGAVLFIVRTALEDKTLQKELPGYREYAERVRYRLLPGIW